MRRFTRKPTNLLLPGVGLGVAAGLLIYLLRGKPDDIRPIMLREPSEKSKEMIKDLRRSDNLFGSLENVNEIEDPEYSAPSLSQASAMLFRKFTGYGKTIYLVGEQHNREARAIDQNNISLEKLMKDSGKQIDFFLEVRPDAYRGNPAFAHILQKIEDEEAGPDIIQTALNLAGNKEKAIQGDYKIIPEEEVNELSPIILTDAEKRSILTTYAKKMALVEMSIAGPTINSLHEYMKMNRSDKIRYHWTDIRRLEKLSDMASIMTAMAQGNSYFASASWDRIRKLFPNRETTEKLFKQWSDEDKLQKQIGKIKDVNIRNYMTQKLNDCFSRGLNEINFGITSQTMSDVDKLALTSFVNNLMFAWFCLMDWYILARMFKIPQRQGRSFQEYTNIVLYAGALHTREISIALLEMGFELVYNRDDNGPYTLSLSGLKLPLFS